MLYFLPSEGESPWLLVMGIGEPCLCSGAPARWRILLMLNLKLAIL